MGIPPPTLAQAWPCAVKGLDARVSICKKTCVWGGRTISAKVTSPQNKTKV